MSGFAQHHLSVAAPRPAQDPADVPQLPEPDTPTHHAYRGLSTAGWRHRLINAVQLLIAFLLIVAAGTWIFIDTQDLQLKQRGSALRAGQTRYLLPDGTLALNEESHEKPAGSLIKASEFGLSHYADDYEEGKLVLPSAREKWLQILDPITVQSIIPLNPHVDKRKKIVILLPGCCNATDLSERDITACHRHVMEICPVTAPTECYRRAVAAPLCQHKDQLQDHRLSYQTALLRLIPALKELGWSNIEAHTWLGDEPPIESAMQNDVCAISDSARSEAESALRDAKIIVADAASLESLLQQYSAAAFIAIETSDSATLPQRGELDNERVLGIWRAQALNNPGMQNGPLIDGLSHLAQLPGSQVLPQYSLKRDSQFSYQMLYRIQPWLSHAFRLRHPLDCGGNIEHLRFAGAFAQNFSHWHPPRMSERIIDIAFISNGYRGEAQKDRQAEGKLLLQHKEGLVQRLRNLRHTSRRHNVLIRRQKFHSYPQYLSQLQDIKVLVSPYGSAEWGHMDFEAILCGCLLVKVNPSSYVVYPDVFKPKKHVLSVSADWSDLEENVMAALQDAEHAQRVADRATMILLEYSDMRRYAGDINVQLSNFAQRVP